MSKHVKARAAQDEREERAVRKLARSQDAPADWIWHARMVVESWAGKTPEQIAAELHCHPQTVRIHVARFNQQGIEGLGVLGRKPRLTKAERSIIVALPSQVPPGRLVTQGDGTMVAHQEHLNLLNKGVEIWNQWRQKNLGTHPDLQGADLHGAQLQGVNLRGALLQGTNFSEAQLQNALFAEANLQEAFLGGAQLQKANLTRVQLCGADLRGAILEETILAEAQLQNADFEGAQLQGAIFVEAQLQGAFLGRTQLQGARFNKAQLQGARFNKAQLQGADFREAQLQKADFREAQLQKADFRGAQLQGAFFRLARLQGATLQLAFLDTATRLDGITLGDEKDGFVSLADVGWGAVNLAVVDWAPVRMLGDEHKARQKKMNDGKIKDKATRIDEFRTAVRANRQLVVVLRDQGLNEEADHFAYRAQLLQRAVWRLQRNWLKYTFWWFLYLLAGYGYRPLRSLTAYLLFILSFAIAFYTIGHLAWYEAIVVSLTAFHGRGFFSQQYQPGDPQSILAAAEAVVGLFIEISFIATFTQRFFGR